MDTIFAMNWTPMEISRSRRFTFIDGSRKFLLNDLLSVPSVSKNLLFIKCFCKDNHHVQFEFDEQFVKVKDKTMGETLYKGTMDNGLHCLLMDVKKKGTMEVLFISNGSKDLWHRQLGHLNSDGINILAHTNAISITDSNKVNLLFESCVLCKTLKSNHLVWNTLYMMPLGLVFMDTWGLALRTIQLMTTTIFALAHTLNEW